MLLAGERQSGKREVRHLARRRSASEARSFPFTTDIETILRNRSPDDLASQKVDQPESEMLLTVK